MSKLLTILVFTYTFSYGFGQISEGIPIDHLTDLTTEISLSQIAENSHYVKLETNQECLLGRIKGCWLVGNDIIVLDGSSKLFFVFSKDGSFKTKIGKIGKGPGEYITCDNYFIHNDEITLYDNVTRSIIKYDLSGKLMSNLKIDYYPDGIGCTDEKTILFYPTSRLTFNNGYVLSWIDKNGKVLKNYHKRDPINNSVNFITRLFQYNDKFHYWDAYYDTVYVFDGKTNKPAFHFELGKNRIPNEIWINHLQLQEQGHKYIWISKFWVFDSFVFVSFVNKGRKGKQIVWERAAKKGYPVPFDYDTNSWGIINDIDGGPPFSPHFMANSCTAARVWEVVDLKSYLSNGIICHSAVKNPISKKSLVQIIEDSQINDNPIIQLVTFKTDEK